MPSTNSSTLVQPLTVGPIVGVTTPTSVRLWGRGEPLLQDRRPRRCFGSARLTIPGKPAGRHQSFVMLPHFDFTGVAQFDGLSPDTTYKFQIGYFHTDDATELEDADKLQLDWTKANEGTIKTPKANADETTFVFGSCRYILRILGGLFFDTRGDKIFRSVVQKLDKQPPEPLDFFLMVGDQIYADDMNFVLPDTKADEFFSRYRSAFSQEHLRSLMQRVPTYMILDDHEIEDNWTQDKFTQGASKRNLFAAAMQAYESYQVVHGPAFNASADDWKSPKHYWYRFSSGPADVFVLDTRTERFVKPPRVMIGARGL